MFQAGATCYQTPAAANSASGSAQSGGVVLIGGQSFILAFNSSTDNSITYDYSPLGGGAVVSQTVVSIPPVCGLLTAADAVEAGWMIGGAWIAAYSVMFLVGVLKDHFSPQDGSSS